MASVCVLAQLALAVNPPAIQRRGHQHRFESVQGGKVGEAHFAQQMHGMHHLHVSPLLGPSYHTELF